MACETAGVGVYSSSAAVMTSTPLAARTSSALANAGADRAWVSNPMNSGPSMPRCLRYAQMAWVIGEHVALVEARVEASFRGARRCRRRPAERRRPDRASSV